jgi:group II intron reverse transcriptase/maturase
MALEPEVEKIFHPDSYGYRPRKSALDAVGVCRERCWVYDWVIDLDIKGFFDNLDHDLVLKAVARHTDQKWVLLYVERWLKAPLQRPDGTLVARDRGSPQGSAISPLLANLFMHYAFDMWMAREFPAVPFERYCDDVVVHCRSEGQARLVRDAIARRLAECGGLQLHPEKTRIVYCKDGKRRDSYEHTSFTFLGYGFRVRKVRTRHGDYFFGFNPAVSDEAAKRIRAQIRSWRLHLRSGWSLKDLAREVNMTVRGWINYYGRFYPSALYPSLNRINEYLVRWVVQKYKRYRGKWKRAREVLRKAERLYPLLFAHWKLVKP